MKEKEPEIETPLTLLDLNRVLDYILKLRQEWDDKLVVHMRIGGESILVPATTANAYNVVNRLGGPDQIDYLTATVLGSFMFSADFGDGMLRLVARDENLLTMLSESWKRTSRGDELSPELVNVAVATEGKRFVLLCIDDSGRLRDFPGGQPILDEAYVASRLGRIGMKHILRRFCEWLVSSQYEDGGWGSQEKSEVLTTASAVLVLLSPEIMDVTGRLEALQRAVEFLTVTEGKEWMWPSHASTSFLLPAAAILAFVKYGGRLTRPIERPIIIDAKGLASCDAALIDHLNDVSALDKRTVEDAYNILYEEMKREEGKGTRVLTSLICLGSLREKSLVPMQAQFLREKLIEYRNDDGGWPRRAGERSELLPTIFSLLSHKVLHNQLASQS